MLNNILDKIHAISWKLYKLALSFDKEQDVALCHKLFCQTEKHKPEKKIKKPDKVFPLNLRLEPKKHFFTQLDCFFFLVGLNFSTLHNI